MSRDSDSGLYHRALAAYWRTGGTEQPSRASGVVELGERRYVVLRGGGGVLTVYRIRYDGMLKRMKRWPRDLAI